MTNPLRGMRFRRDHRWTPRHLSAYLDEDLVARSRARIQRHVRECPECRHALHSLERMLGRLRDLPPLSDGETPDIAAAVRRRLRDPSPR
jgi:anti-sigma factor RsiW